MLQVSSLIYASPRSLSPPILASAIPTFFTNDNNIITTTTTTTTIPLLHSPKKLTISQQQEQISDSCSHKTTQLVLEQNNIAQCNYNFDNISQFNDLLTALVNAHELELASKLYHRLLGSYHFDPDSRTYSTMIQWYCKHKDPEKAEGVLRQMLDKRFQPNISMFNILIDELCERGRVQKAREVMRTMARVHCEPTIRTYNRLLKGLCYVGRVEEAYDLLINLKRSRSSRPDIYTYTIIMDGFCKVGRSNEAIELLDEALETGLSPSAATFSTLFTGYFREGRPLEGIKLLEKMKEFGCTPDYTAYNTLLHGLLKWGEVKQASMIYKEVVRVGLRVDDRVMNTLLRGLCRRSRRDKGMLNDVYQAFETMNTWQISVYDFTYDLLIEAFWRGKKTNEALMSLENMVSLGYDPKGITFDYAIRALCGEGKVDEALNVLGVYREKRTPSCVSFEILVDELNFQGRLFTSFALYGLAMKLSLDFQPNFCS